MSLENQQGIPKADPGHAGDGCRGEEGRGFLLLEQHHLSRAPYLRHGRVVVVLGELLQEELHESEEQEQIQKRPMVQQIF